MSRTYSEIKKTVWETVKKDICVSCGICASICPVQAITMHFERGQFLPRINNNCTHCGMCSKICPGIDFLPKEFREKDILSIHNENYLGCYIVYAFDNEIRRNSTSGGGIIMLVKSLINNGDYDYAFVLNFKRFDGKEAKLEKTNDLNVITVSAKSKYIPVSFYNVAEELKKQENKKYIIIGTGCEIYGIKKFIKQYNLREDNLLFLGVFCDKTLNFNLLNFFEARYGKNGEKLSSFDFRNKEKSGWPGDTKIVFDSKREIFVDRRVRMQLKDYFQLRRCLLCLDKLNCFSDIAFGDCYIKGYEDCLGKSNIIIRTEKGREVFEHYRGSFDVKEITFEQIADTQQVSQKKKAILFQRFFNQPHKHIFVSFAWRRALAKIKLGQKRKILLIQADLFLNNIARVVKKFGRRFTRELYHSYSAAAFFIYTFQPHHKKFAKNIGDNIIIVGGELFNKGAQAMTFTVVDQLRRKYLDKQIILFSKEDFERPVQEKNLYKFNIVPWDWNIGFKILGIGLQSAIFNSTKEFKYKTEEIKKVIDNAYFIVDISGYGLSSQWDWFRTIRYLTNIAVAKKFGINYYILPQSMGPFDYPLVFKFLLYPLLFKYLKYPLKIYVREKAGFDAVKKFSDNNLKQCHDIVLKNQRYNLNNIYNEFIEFRKINIPVNSIGIIPNIRVVERIDSTELISCYKLIITTLIDSGFSVYLLRHSSEDLQFCYQLKNIFPNNEDVILLNEDFNAIEIESLVKQFHFIITSRYHSLVHAYKHGIPALVIGWAIKYSELMNEYNQLSCYFDASKSISTLNLESALHDLIKNRDQERSKILLISDFLLQKESNHHVFEFGSYKVTN